MNIHYIELNRQKNFRMKYSHKIFKIDLNCADPLKISELLSRIIKNRKDYKNLNDPHFNKVNLLKITDCFNGVQFSFGITIKENKKNYYKIQIKGKEKEANDLMGFIIYIQKELIERILTLIN